MVLLNNKNNNSLLIITYFVDFSFNLSEYLRVLIE